MEPTDTSFVEAARTRPDIARFFIEEPGRPPRVLVLAAGGEARVGRDDGIEISLADPRVSRLHARLAFDGREVRVYDLGSSNGTFIGDRRIEGMSELPLGSVVRVGATHIVRAPGVESSTRPEPHAATGDPAALDSEVVAEDPASEHLFATVRRFAKTSLPVLVQGETGSGKEVVARALHRLSRRAGRPFIAVNCAALPEGIAESELFGHERGSFTGAQSRKIGLFEAAHGGTLLLDEVGELSSANQPRLLRVLQEHIVHRVGSLRPTPVDVRVVAATNRDLAVDVARGRFREDLYFRLNGVTIQVPPLRERPADILPLARRCLDRIGGGFVISDEAAEALRGYPWPGNVRELSNAMERAAAVAQSGELQVEHLPPMIQRGTNAIDETSPLRARVDETERRAIVAALAANHNNQSRAARDLGISRRALIYKMERYGLKAPPGGARASS